MHQCVAKNSTVIAALVLKGIHNTFFISTPCTSVVAALILKGKHNSDVVGKPQRSWKYKRVGLPLLLNSFFLLRLIPHTYLPATRWDAFIAASPQRVMYAYAWYLDVVSPQWQALVLEEDGVWKAVMPLPTQQKWGLNVVQQPFFCQFLGVFTTPSVELASVQTAFLEALSTYFWYVSSYSGRFGENLFPAPWETKRCFTHVFPLNVPYEQLHQRYSTDRRINLGRALRFGWEITESEDMEPMLQLFQENHAANIQGGVTETAYELLRKVVEALQQRNAARIVYAHKDGKIEAGALFATYDQRIVYLFNAASAVGRKGNARALLIDQCFQAFANSGYIFDFESPEKESIASFYASFGAQSEEYWVLHYNALPFPLKQWKAYRRKKSFLKI